MCAQGSLRRMFRCRDFDRSYQLGGYAIHQVSSVSIDAVGKKLAISCLPLKAMSSAFLLTVSASWLVLDFEFFEIETGFICHSQQERLSGGNSHPLS